jgi:hypothetical protein
LFSAGRFATATKRFKPKALKDQALTSDAQHCDAFHISLVNASAAQSSRTMFLIPARTSLLATRVAARRVSTTIKTHKAKDEWAEFLKTRPPLDVRRSSPMTSSVRLFDLQVMFDRIVFSIVFVVINVVQRLI